MCGIFGYFGDQDAKEMVLNGLRRLEYRGYDSWGIAVAEHDTISLAKKIGKIDPDDQFFKLPVAHIGIGHTRWATHGGVTQENAHPHTASDKSFVLAQNGIVENYQELKKQLLSLGYHFISETDTEIIVHLIEECRKTSSSLREAVMKAFCELTGRNTIIVLNKNDNEIIATRNGSPLIIGTNPETKEVFISSDTLSFGQHATYINVMENNQLIHIVNGNIELFNALTGAQLSSTLEKAVVINDKIDKEGYDHFMIKEIVEQQFTIHEAIQYSEEELKPLIETILGAERVYTIGAGTASLAAAQIAYLLGKHGNIKAIELKSYEVESYKDLFSEKDLIFAVSQSGETADTIEALEFAKAKGTKVASIVNMSGSTITRMSDYPYFSRSGPEICVASTKAFTAQVSFGLLVALSCIGKHDLAHKTINTLSKKLETYFSEDLFTHIKTITKKLITPEHFFILGKGQNYYISLEGSLKIKEITYKHFEGFAAGELKHGVIALIEKNTPVFVIVSDDESKDDLYNATAQVKTRGAWVIGIGKQNNSLFDEFIQTVEGGYADSIANVLPFQLISYFLAIALKRDPDKPRHLAKSVTVK